MSQDTEKIKQTVRKLLNIADPKSNAADGEIENALRFAKTLMMKYHLTEEDISPNDTNAPDDPHINAADLEFAECISYSKGKKLVSWEDYLAQFVCELIGSVQCYFQRWDNVRKTEHGTIQFDKKGNPKIGQHVIFYGTPEDIQLAKELFEELQLTIYVMARMKFGSVMRGEGRSYGDGFVTGLMTKLQKATAQLTQDRSNALMIRSQLNALVKREGAADWLTNTKGIKLRKGKGYSIKHYSDAWATGHKDGKSLKVTSSRKKKLK